eukprot:475670-Karenia_brevis.AAC.1
MESETGSEDSDLYVQIRERLKFQEHSHAQPNTTPLDDVENSNGMNNMHSNQDENTNEQMTQRPSSLSLGLGARVCVLFHKVLVPGITRS